MAAATKESEKKVDTVSIGINLLSVVAEALGEAGIDPSSVDPATPLGVALRKVANLEAGEITLYDLGVLESELGITVIFNLVGA